MVRCRSQSAAQPELGQNECNICYDEITSENTISASCGHPFCANCWKSYVDAAIANGIRCLTLPCPYPGCPATAGAELVESVASAAAREKFYKYLLRSYVNCSRQIKWCPDEGCNFAVELDGDDYDVTCGCSHKFCWNCAAEHHHLVGCETVARGMEKNKKEMANTQWIDANTKPCPKCRRLIEKIGGCNWMTCGQPLFFPILLDLQSIYATPRRLPI